MRPRVTPLPGASRHPLPPGGEASDSNQRPRRSFLFGECGLFLTKEIGRPYEVNSGSFQVKKRAARAHFERFDFVGGRLPRPFVFWRICADGEFEGCGDPRSRGNEAGYPGSWMLIRAPGRKGLNRLWKNAPAADNHPGAQGATPPESGGELSKTLPSSDEEGWRAERRGGADKGTKGYRR